jgi:hypothetical protein
LMIYVANILILMDDAKLKRIEEFLKAELTRITMEVENKQSCLGMKIVLKSGQDGDQSLECFEGKVLEAKCEFEKDQKHCEAEMALKQKKVLRIV